MNENESTATQLRSWKPRQPSGRVGQRLFATNAACLAATDRGVAATAEETASSAAGYRLSLLAPAMAVLMLGVILFRPAELCAPLPQAESPQPMFAAALSNQTLAAFLPGSFDHSQNTVPLETFEWTKEGTLTSSIPSLAPPRGNN